MAVGGARGIAVGAAAAAVVAGCGDSNPGTSQDQRPRVPDIGAAAAGNPRSRGGFGEGREAAEEEAAVVDGGRRPPLFYLSLRMGERAEDRGQKFFRSRISFCSFALFCSGDPASADGRGGSFPASVSGRAEMF